MYVKDPTTIRIIWLSPEQPPDGHTPLTPEQDDDRREEIQQKQLSLIRHYRALLAEKDEEIHTLKAGIEQRHALIEQQRVELDGLRQDKKTLKNMLRTKGDEVAMLRREVTSLRDVVAQRDALRDELAALRQSPSVVEVVRRQAELIQLRKENAELQAEQARLSRFYKTYCAEQHAALDKVLREMATH